MCKRVQYKNELKVAREMMRKQSLPNIRFLLIILLVITATMTGICGKSLAEESIKVGIFQNKPIVYFEDGPKGLFVEVLNYVAEKENWELEYVTCELKDCLKLIDTGGLDLMTSLGQSPERLDALTFSKEPIWTFWGTIYSHKPDVLGVFDLKGQKIGVRHGNKITSGLQTLLSEFGIPVEYVGYDNYESAYEAFISNNIDAIAVNNTYGFDKLKELGKYKTPIVFNPFSAYFATPKNGRYKDKLAVIDEYVKSLKADKTSIMHLFHSKWFGGTHAYLNFKIISTITASFILIIVLMMALWRSRSLKIINEKLLFNIAERVQAERILKESEKKYRDLLENIPLKIFLKDEKSVYVSCNTNYARDLNVEPKKIEGTTDYDYYPKELAEKYIRDDQRIVKSGKGEDIVEKYVVNSRDFWIHTVKTPLKNNDGKVTGILGVFRDITAQKKAEATHASLEERLQQAQKMEAIGTLAGGIAHDFNNILSVILGYAEMAKEDSPPGSNFDQDLDKVLDAGNRAKDLVKQILTFSRQEKTERIPLQLQSLVKEALKMLRASIPTTINIQDNIDSDCGVVLADPTQVHQIIMNLCSNANHAMEKTGGLLKIELENIAVERTTPPEVDLVSGKYVRLTISDTGSGIGPDIIDKIFDPYFTTKEVGKGTGMGLAISHGIITDYGGTITVESALGKGTTFHLYFPIVEQEVLAPDKDEEFPSGSGRILFIDDEEILAQMGKDMLERLGYHVTTRQSSLDALATFQNAPDAFDAVITDQTMPGMTGSDLARRMLQIRPDIPIILCTGYSNLVDEHTAKMIGIKKFALKPLTKGVIAKLIRNVLDSK